MTKRQNTGKLTLAAMMLALCFILPYFTGSIPTIGSVLLPMHLPAFLAGLLCGPWWGMAVGFVAPILRSITLGMPPSMVMAVPMAFELATYAGVTGGIYHLAKTKRNLATLPAVYAGIIPALVVGRLVYALAKAAMTLAAVNLPALLPYVVESILSAAPGVIVQLTLIPAIMVAVERQKNPKHSHKTAETST